MNNLVEISFHLILFVTCSMLSIPRNNKNNNKVQIQAGIHSDQL